MRHCHPKQGEHMKDEALKLALEALERGVATCFDRYSHEQVMCRPEHFINQTIAACEQALAAPVQEPVGYEHHEYRPYGAPGEIRIHAILKSCYVMPDGSTAGDYQWVIDQCRADRNTIKLLPLYTTPPAQPAPVQEPKGKCKECLTYNGHQDACSHAPAQPAPVQQEPNQSPYPEYDRGFSAGWDRGFAAAQPAPVQPVAWANPNDLKNFDMKVRTNGGPLHTVPLCLCTPPAQPAHELTNIQRHEQNVQKFLGAQPAPVQEREYVYTCNGCDTLYREDDVSCDCTVNGLMEFTRHILTPDTAPPAQPAVPDAMTSADIQEHIEYVAGWNDCRAETLKMRKP